MNICLDFDGVLHDTSTVPAGRRLGQPLEGARDACWDLVHAGHKLWVCTSRQHNLTDTEWLQDWLRFWDFPFIRVVALKPRCDLYLDDRGWRFTTWEEFQHDTTVYADDVVPEVPQWTL